MSLQVWLPLNGDLHNQGLSNFTITNNNATINNNGKIGQCYAFNGSNNYIYIDYNFYNTQYSVSAWVYSTSASATQTVCCDRTATGFGFSIFLINGKLRIDPGGNNIRWITSYTYPINTWFHLCVSYDGTKVSYYINGEFKESHNTALDSSYWGNVTSIGAAQVNNSAYGNYLNGYLNDVRIYNHCLSDKEVEEISKGLVLHYKLNQPTNLNYNLYTGSKNFTGNWVNNNSWTTSTEDYNGFTVKQRSGTWSGLAQNITATNGDIFTISFWAKIDSGGKLQSVHRSNLGNVTTGLNILNGNFSSSNIWVNTNEDGTNWQRYWATLQITSSDITYLQWRIENSVANKNLYIAGLTLEKGYGTKIWSLSTSEAGLLNIIYDSSGYNHNGSLLGAPTLSIDSDKYSNSIYFNGNDDGILIEDLELSNIINNQVTYSFWIKPSNENGARSVYFGSYSGTSWSIEKTTGNVIRSYWNGSPDTTCTGAVITDNVWQHVCIVKNGTSDLKVYINGVQKFSSTATLSAKTFPTTYRIGRDTRSGDGTPYHGNMSDFRIYATALTAEQVLELYNTSATIDNKGNIYARELVEI